MTRYAGILAAALIGVPHVVAFAAGAMHADHVIRVGPSRQVTRIAEAALLARDGDTIEVDAADYVGDVAVWDKSGLTIRAVGGRARLVANGASAEGKAIWVIRGDGVTVENFTFTGARVPDRNGAGIRHEQGRLKVSNCIFTDNENGLLSGNNRDAELEISASEFGHNGAGDGQSHDLYVGTIRLLRVTGSYFHHARIGHLLKSRALENFVMYNRLTDEIGGHASYELEFPGGGLAYVVGNIIEQSPQTENSVVISFGSEGYAWARNELYLTSNTLIDDRLGGGEFLRVRPGAGRVVAINNLLVGADKLDVNVAGEFAANYNVKATEFPGGSHYDVRLRERSHLVGRAVDPGTANNINLRPTQEYHHPRQLAPVASSRFSPGAMQSLAR